MKTSELISCEKCWKYIGQYYKDSTYKEIFIDSLIKAIPTYIALIIIAIMMLSWYKLIIYS